MSVRAFLGLRGDVGDPAPIMARAESDPDVSAVADAIYELIQSRLSAFTLAEARDMPPVIRATMLVAGIGASLSPLAYRDGVAMAVQPRAVLRPDPFGTRYDFVWQTIASLWEHGCAPWYLTGLDSAGYPSGITVLDHAEVEHGWAPRLQGLVREYRWRGRTLSPETFRMVTLGRRAGELHGHGPLTDMLPYLAPVHMAEQWAMGWFASGGIPDTVITAKDGDLTADEADAIRTRWLDRRNGPGPAVIPNSLLVNYPQVDPERAQLHESRSYGATIVARGGGIPAALLHVETSGASITYANAMAAVDELVKATIAPSYLAPIEQAWSELLPRPQVVRFDLNELQRTDMQARAGIYQTLVTAGILDADEARAYEGWGPRGRGTEAVHAFDPAPEALPVAVEVPA
jgi:HK97 family phage portal protein